VAFAPRPGVSPEIVVRIAGVGVELPADVLTTAEAEERADLVGHLGLPPGWLERTTGVRQRRRAAPGVRPSELAAAAARKALERAHVDARSVDTLLFAGITRDVPAPSTAQIVAAAVGAVEARAFDVANATNGLIDAIDVGDSLIRSGKAERVLVATGERAAHGAGCPRPETMEELRESLPTLVLGDGGGAVVLVPSDDPRRGLRAREFRGAPASPPGRTQHRPPPEDTCGACGSPLYPHSRSATDDGFASALALLGPAMHAVMQRTGWRYDDLDVVFCHQPTKRIVEQATALLADAGGAADRIWGIAERFGNTTTTSLPLAMAEAEAAGTLVPGARVLLLAPSARGSAAAVTLVW
jgi:3-oxoacyl-[acyl-carrier-protein] synthase III